MREVVINSCAGIFDLSQEALIKYVRRKNIRLHVTRNQRYLVYHLKDKSDRKDEDDSLFELDKDIARDDPDLVYLVKDMGDKVNTNYSSLKIVQIPDGMNFEIECDDGKETIKLL